MTPLLLLLVQPVPVTLDTLKVGDAPCTVITADLSDPRVRVGVTVPNNFPGTDEPFSSMVKRSDPIAAVNGAYFAKDTLNPIGDVVIDGRVRWNGRMGTAMTLTADKKCKFLRVIRHKTYAWGAYETVLACGPALMLDGQINVDWRKEGFRDPHVTGRTYRMAVGHTPEGKLKLVQIKKAVTFEEEARIMQKLGCFEAMNLDAGASTGMYFGGKFLATPSRKLTNILGIWVTK